MGSKNRFYSVESQDKGFDDVGFAQTAGVISSVAQYKTGQYAKYAAVTANAAHNLTKGQAINITGTTDYDGPTRVLEIVSPTVFVIKRAFTVTKSGAWDLKAAKGNWDAFIPLDVAVDGANLTFEYWDPNQQGGTEFLGTLQQGVIYRAPGGIKRVGIATAGNIRLIRAATTKPHFAKQSKSVPTIVGYNPTGAAVGATIDIIGTNFDPIPDRNAVRFTNGVRANVVSATEEILTIVVPTGTVSGPIANICNGGQNATGPTFVVN
jgi:hypothetical protein